MSLTKTDLGPVLGRIVSVQSRHAGQLSEGRLQAVTDTALVLWPVLVVSSAGELLFSDDCVAVIDLADVLSVRSTPDEAFERTRAVMAEEVRENHAHHVVNRARARQEREREERSLAQQQPRAVSEPAMRPGDNIRAPGMYL